MLKDVEWSEDGTYTPESAHTPLEFFTQGLQNSYMFDLQLGYFNSAAISVLSGAFATFIAKGGTMRMALNHIVSRKDRIAIIEGTSDDGCKDIVFDLSNMNALKNTLDEYGEQFFKCLAYMIKEGRIEICIIKPRQTTGIAHTKRGQFRDGDTTVSFTGSANFTLGGFFNNLEEIVISHSTSPDPSIQTRIARQTRDFNQLMAGHCPTVEYLPAKELVVAIVTNFGGADIKDLLQVEKQLKAYKKKDLTIEKETEIVNLPPAFPYLSGPREYQQKAYEHWKSQPNKQKGLFAMATGTGKTLTSLNCLLNIYKKFNFYKAIILVPTITLVEQWEQECRKFHFNNIVKVSSRNHNWHSEIDNLKAKEQFNYSGVEPSYIIIATYASFARPASFAELTDFGPDTLRRMLLIADECHNMGAPGILNKLGGIRFARRIGLSATPDRQFDEQTNSELQEFFGCVNGEYTFEYTMMEAIDNGFLCKYYYYPHLIRLQDDEMNDYVEISKSLAKYFDSKTGTFPKNNDDLMRLLLRRKRIIHKARNKVAVFEQIIQQRYAEKGNLRYTLVYVPEGAKPDNSDADKYETTDLMQNDDYTDKLIDLYSQKILEVSETTTIKKFVAGMKDREGVLREFAEGETEVLTSMKCLDEGVDVPRSELAIFCASTGNPRQFIQRRGRILRKHVDKNFAIIHDLVVIPEVNYAEDNYRMEQSLLRGELARVRDFASLSENADYAYRELEDIAAYYELPLF